MLSYNHVGLISVLEVKAAESSFLGEIELTKRRYARSTSGAYGIKQSANAISICGMGAEGRIESNPAAEKSSGSAGGTRGFPIRCCPSGGNRDATRSHLQIIRG